jgi:metal-responsive CopG/Arc/MetJ family transcriptional regulator
MAKKKKRADTRITTMRIPQGLLADLTKIAGREGRTRSSLVIQVLRAYASRAQRQPKQEQADGSVLD